MNADGPLLIDYAASPKGLMTPVPLSAVRLTGGLWGRVFATNWQATIPHVFEHVREDLFDKFRRAGDPTYAPDQPPAGSRRGREANLHRTLEAAASSLAHDHDPRTHRWIEEGLEVIEPAADFDGYLHANLAPRQLADRRWRDGALNELYATGHMIQAGVAHHRATGSDRYLRLARRAADHMCEVFLPGGNTMRPSHPEVEMALIELYRVTGKRAYLQLARYFIDQVGALEFPEIAGHSVQIAFLACAIVDAYAETGQEHYWKTSERLWQDMVTRKMYVTGAIGGRRLGEAMGHEYELPHEHGYAETCAAIGSAMWSLRALQVSGQARFADLMELCWHNSILCGVNLEGNRFFYDNPLQSSGRGYFDPWRPALTPARHDYEYYHSWLSAPTRQEWFWVDRPEYRHMYRVACCPPNLTRSIAQLPAYFYSTGPNALWVHMYGQSELDVGLADGRLRLSQQTDYPWDGRISLTIREAPAARIRLHLRIPGWARAASAELAGRPLSAVPGQYLEIEREWRPGDEILLSLAMPVEMLVADPAVAEARDSVALKRGPVVYAIEGSDNPGINLRQLRLPAGLASGEVEIEHREELLGGVVTLEAPALVANSDGAFLYRPADAPRPDPDPTRLKAIPYFAWDNRDAAVQMAVWMPRHRPPAEPA